MLNDEQLINLMVSEPSWEDVIVRIVTEEGMDPWAVDICNLTDAFSRYLAKMEKLDLHVPARFILIAAILLRMKSDVLITQKKKVTFIADPEAKSLELIKELSQVPPLQPPVKRVPIASVALDELIGALRKAFDVRERRVERKQRIRRIVEAAVPEATEDISNRINNLLGQIQDAIKDIEKQVKFSALVKKWDRQEIVNKLIPLLHLSNEGKIEIDQEEIFNEITVKMRKEKDGEQKQESNG